MLVGHKAAMQLPAEGMVTPLQAACSAGALACARLLIDGLPADGRRGDEMGASHPRAAARGAAKCCGRCGPGRRRRRGQGGRPGPPRPVRERGGPGGGRAPAAWRCPLPGVRQGPRRRRRAARSEGAGKKPLALAALRAASATSTAQADLANALSELLLAAGAKPPPPPGEEKKGGGKKKK